MVATLDRTKMETWDIDDADELVSALEAAKVAVEAADEDGVITFVFMVVSEPTNVSRADLIKVDMGDGSFCYEIELA